MAWGEGGHGTAGRRLLAPSYLLVPPLVAPRNCGGAAFCTTVIAAPVSTGRAPRSCCWLCCCCWAATGASRPAGISSFPASPTAWSGPVPLLPQHSLLSHLVHPRGNSPLRVPGLFRAPPSLGWLVAEPERDTLFRRDGGGGWSPGPGLVEVVLAAVAPSLQPRRGTGERLGAVPPAASQPHPHREARSAETSGGRAEAPRDHRPNPR